MHEIILVDTEFTVWEGYVFREPKDWEHPEIYQLSAIKLDPNTFEEKDCFNILIKPKLNPTISEYTSNFTGITNKMLENAITFSEAFKKFKKFCKDCICYYFNNKDFRYGEDVVFEENFKIHNIPKEKMPKLVNIAPWFYNIFNKSGIEIGRVSSGTIAKKLGIEKENENIAHSAINDVRSMAKSLRYFAYKGFKLPFMIM